MSGVSTEVAAAWGWAPADITPLAGGLINATYVVGERAAVLQRLHPIFAGEVNLDLEAVTAHVAGHGLPTPRLVRARDGRAWVSDGEGRAWRALTYVEGESHHEVPSTAHAESGGALVGRFHRAVADLRHDYAFARAGVHDTAFHLGKLRDRAEIAPSWEVRELAHDILADAASLPEMPAVPRRHCHGDLKISNLLFRGGEAHCLVDLDTLGLQTMAFELGDAMRSWCNPAGEDVTAITFDTAIFAAAIRGFLGEAAALVTADERRSIVIGLETVCLELAARFAVDVFDDSYFGWDATRFPSRRAHNHVRARGQLALGKAVRQVRGDLLDVVLSGS